jgi:hypothetical protein
MDADKNGQITMMNAGRGHLLFRDSDFVISARRKLERAIDCLWLPAAGRLAQPRDAGNLGSAPETILPNEEPAMPDPPNHCMTGRLTLDGGRARGQLNGWRKR